MAKRTRSALYKRCRTLSERLDRDAKKLDRLIDELLPVGTEVLVDWSGGLMEATIVAKCSNQRVLVEREAKSVWHTPGRHRKHFTEVSKR